MIEVEVTQEDIDEGKNCSEGKCVIELATARAIGAEPSRMVWGYTNGALLSEDHLTDERTFFVVADDRGKVKSAVLQNDHRRQGRATQPFTFTMYEEE